MKNLLVFLKGKRTYLVAATAIVLSIASNFIYVPDWVFQVLLGTGALTLRDSINGIKKDSKAILDAADKK